METGSSQGDLDGNGVTDDADLDYLVHDILATHYGDANLDGRFDTGDLVKVFAAGEYEDSLANNSRWATGDWNLNGDFDTGDLVKAFTDGGFEKPALAQVVATAKRSLLDANLIASAQFDNGDDVCPFAMRKRGRGPIDVAAVDALFADVKPNRYKSMHRSSLGE
jgi:hypothetical protein